MNYLEWNDLVASHFFKPEMAGRKVFVFVTPEVLDQVGRAKGVDHADFVHAVTVGSPWVTKSGLCYRAYETYLNWRQRQLPYPPYIGYLALFVLAAGLEGDFAPHAYYPRLRTLLGEDPIIGQYPGFPRMRDLWDDLELWSLQDKRGELGLFNVMLAGKWQHVGVPIAQTLLTQEELEALPALFLRAGLDPTSPPSEEDLASLVGALGANDLRNRTLRVLGQADEPRNELREALIQILLDDLLSWDGTARAAQPKETERHPRGAAPAAAEPAEHRHVEGTTVYGGSLRLRCQYDRVAARAKVLIHCRSVHPFPEEGLVLGRPGEEARYECDDLASGWSSPISHRDGGTVDATEFDWKTGAELLDLTACWRFRLTASAVRVFVTGAKYGLGDLVEEPRLPASSPFYIAASEECCALIGRWGSSSCTGFREMPVLSGLPRGWRLFYAAQANSDELVRDVYPILTLPRSTNIRFDGGVRVAASNQYFAFAPPRIFLSGSDEGVELRCNNTLMKRDQPSGQYLLPGATPTEVRLVVEARRANEEIARKSLYLVPDIEWPGAPVKHRFGRYGERVPDQPADQPVFAGALVEGLQVPTLVTMPPVDTSRYPKAILLGQLPGQVAYWPRERLPIGWSPVWAVVMRKSGYAVFCGPDISQAGVSSADTGDRRLISRWKEILWHRRRRIRPPAGTTLLALWKQYQERARHA